MKVSSPVDVKKKASKKCGLRRLSGREKEKEEKEEVCNKKK